MASRASTLRERLKARREKVKEGTLAETSDPSDLSPHHGPIDTWDAAMIEEESVDSLSNRNTTMEIEDEVKDSEQLVTSLKKKRRRVQKEMASLKPTEEEDVSALMETAKLKTKQRLMDETEEDKEDDTSTNADADESIPVLPDDDKSKAKEERKEADSVSTPPSSARTPRTPRTRIDEQASTTPRRMSRNLSQSYRQKLKEKVRAAKDKGKDEVYDESRASGRRLAGMRGMDRKTRFDDPSLVRKDELEAEELLEKSLLSKKKEAEAKTKQSLMPTPEEAYDFFMRQWEPEEESPSEADKPVEEHGPTDEPSAGPSGEGEEPKPESEAAEEAEESSAREGKTPEDTEPLLPDAEEDIDSWKQYGVARAQYVPYHEKIKQEENLFHYPSVRPAKPEERLPEAVNPRKLEDEGFYVGTRPVVPKHNLSKMENRLLKEPNKVQEWFGEDGVLIALPDPLKEVAYRPPIIEELEPMLETEYKKAYVSELDGRYIDRSAEGVGVYQLDVDINVITFNHHHLFSREHVLACRLSDQYKQYISRSRKKTPEFLSDKLRALKTAVNHINDSISNLMSEEKSTTDLERRLNDYVEEIKLTRKQRDVEMKADRTLMKHMIQTWKEIKSLRQFQTHVSSPVKLIVKKEPMNKEKDLEEWNRDLEEETGELRKEMIQEHDKKMKVYKTQLDLWKQQKLAKKEAKQRQKKREKRQSRARDETEEDLIQEDKDNEILSEDLTKPEKPEPVNEASIRQTVIDKYEEIRRKPGEPKIYFELTNGANITPNNQCKRGEQTRRNDINRYKMFVKVLFNDKEVSRTPSKPLSQDFTVRFAQIFNIQIMQWPQSIKLEIYETAGLSTTLLSTVYAPIPESNITSENVHLEELDFSSDLRVSHSHEGVGSNITFSMDKENKTVLCLLSGGVCNASVSWALDDEGNVLVPPTSSSTNSHNAMKGVDAVAALGVAGMSDMDKLTKWIAQSHLDPNDPSNADLMYLMRPVGGGDALVSTYHMPDHFRLEQLQEEFNIATDEEIENSRRFRMIQLREQEIQEFKSKPIPALEKEVPDDVFIDYEKKQRSEEKIKMDESDSHRAAVAKFMQRVREQVMLRYRLAAHQKTLSDIIFEDAVPNIGTIIPNLLKFAEPHRPLKPVRKERKKVTAQNLQGMDVKVLVNVVRAFGIPVRASTEHSLAGDGRDSQPPTSARGSIKNIAGETKVRPYIEAMFQRNTVSTSVAEGPNPSWNEELALPFKPPNNDYSSANLQTVNDVLYLNLFDEYVTDTVQNERERGTSIVRRIEKRWLGSIKIPFSTIYFNSRSSDLKIDGTFRLSKPPVLLGYQHENHGRKATEDTIQLGIGDGQDTYLTMFVTIEPALTPAEPAKEKFDSNEDEKLLTMADKWLSEVTAKFPKREYKTTVVDINGKFVFISRYFKSLRPPDELKEEGMSPKEIAERIARYVSLIPFVSDSVVFPGLCDIWSTCDQFLQMLQGDEEEHAVLLMNYFLSLEKKAWLVLGSAIPEGPTAYVMTKEEGSAYWLWNASTGEHFSHRDNYCPLQSIGCLVSPDNIYANIQANDLPSRMNFDLNNASNWKPFFHKGFPNPGISSIQPESLIYFPTDKDFVKNTQEKIERALKDKIMEWRPCYITRWNRYCVQAFRRLLAKLEFSRGHDAQHQHSAELDQILGQYKMSGFPINLPYTEMDPIVDSVFATGVHNVESSDVEFALAVHVHPYPNSILSVWVYVASLIRKR